MYTYTRQVRLTHVGTPRLEMGHLDEKLTKGWGILTAKIPLTYMLNAHYVVDNASRVTCASASAWHDLG